MDKIQEQVVNYIRENQASLIGFLQELIRIPSENHGALGDEKKCQQLVAQRYQELGLTVDVFSPDSLAGIKDHPGYLAGRDYRERPNVIGIWGEKKPGPSVMLAAHIDTVPAQDPEKWLYPPFVAVLKDGKIYGRGACDDKYAIAAAYFAVKALISCGHTLDKPVYLASVVDEENGGGNGSLAACLKYPCAEYLYLDGAQQAAIAGVAGSVISIDLVATKPVATALPVFQGLQLLVEQMEKFSQEELGRQFAGDPLFAGAECARHPLRLYQAGIGQAMGTHYNRGRLIYTIYTLESKAELDSKLKSCLADLNNIKLAGLGLQVEEPVYRTRFFEKTSVPANSPVVEKFRQAHQLVTGEELPLGPSVLSDYYLYNNYGQGQALMTGLSRPFYEPEGPHNINESNDVDKIIDLACSIAVYLTL